MPKAWTKAEINYLKRKIDNREHPADFLEEMNKKFGNERTFKAVRCKLDSMQISLAGCERKMAVPTKAEATAIVKKDIIINRLKAEKQILKKKYEQLIKTSSTQETILEFLKEYLQALPEVDPPKISTAPKSSSEEELVLCLGDIHAGEKVEAEEVNGINEYNFDILNFRLKYLADSVVDISMNKLSGYTFKKLHILGLGDWITGTIHQELVEHGEGTVVECVMNLAYVIAQMIRELATIFEEIEFVGVFGNHGRLHKKPRFKGRYANWDYVCYQTLSMLLANQRNVKFKIPKSFWVLHEINGQNFLILHGDNIKSSLGIPWYGINRTVANLKELLEAKNQRFRYIILGHFHNLGVLDRVKGELIVNGSLIGGNEFSVGAMFTSSEACQHFCGVHHKKGMTFRYKINVQEAPAVGEVPYKYVGSEEVMGDLMEMI